MVDTLPATEDLATRMRRLEARAALSDLVGRYGQLLDARNWDGVAEEFSRDGSLSVVGQTATGRTALKEMFVARLGGFEFTFHYPHSQVFEIVDDEHATGTVSGHAEHGANGVCLLAGVRYADEYGLEDGRWRIASRAVDIRYFLSWSEFAESFHEGGMNSAVQGS